MAWTQISIAVTTSSSSAQDVSTDKKWIEIYNSGSNVAFFRITTSNSDSAATTDYPIAPDETIVIPITSTTFRYLYAITASSTTTLKVVAYD